MKRQKNIVQMKGQGKTPQDQINEEEIGKLSEKRIQSNDNKDDPKSQKQNGKNRRLFHITWPRG